MPVQKFGGACSRVLLALACCASLGACAQHALPPYSAAAAASAPQYHLGSGDKLRIDTFGETTLSGEFEVSAAGMVDLPLVGVMAADGKTPGELSDAIMAQLLARGFLKNPQVSVQVINYRPFYILGEVSKPGTYPYSAGLTVLSAVATAEGFTYRANTKKIFIHHMGSKVEEEVPLSAATPVLPGDTIRIAERYF